MGKKVFFILIAIVVVGSILRFYNLEKKPFWYDEIVTLRESGSPSLYNALNVNYEEKNPPGYIILMYLARKCVGGSEFILRFSSAIAGILSILMIFILTEKLYSYREGLMAAAFSSVSTFYIYCSQEARMYPLLLLFTLFSVLFWIILIKSRSKNTHAWLWAGYVLSAVFCCYLHYYGVLLIFLQGLAVALILKNDRKMIKKFIFAYLINFLIYLPWIGQMVQHSQTRLFWIPMPKITFFPGFLWRLFNKSKILLAAACLLYLYLFVKLLYDYFRRHHKPEGSDIFLLAWLVVPFLIMYTVSLILLPVLIHKYLIISSAPAFILLARSITKLPLNYKIQNTICLFLIGIFLYSFFCSGLNYF